MTKYEEGKARARESAIEWQYNFCLTDHSWDELADAQYYFERLARRFGLVREFRENGII